MKYILLLVLFFFIHSKANNKIPQCEIHIAYAQGQIDALQGDINIKYDSNTREYYFINIPNGLPYDIKEEKSNTNNILIYILTGIIVLLLLFIILRWNQFH